jgi:hypothetical protein
MHINFWFFWGGIFVKGSREYLALIPNCHTRPLVDMIVDVRLDRSTDFNTRSRRKRETEREEFRVLFLSSDLFHGVPCASPRMYILHASILLKARLAHSPRPKVTRPNASICAVMTLECKI